MSKGILYGSWSKGSRRGQEEEEASSGVGEEDGSAVSVSDPGTQQTDVRTRLWNDGHLVELR